MDIVNKLVKLLMQKELTLALAESVTCGMASHQLSTAKGTSKIFAGSLVCYSPAMKKKVLKISTKLIDKYTCESRQVTDAMAAKLHTVIPADVHAAITGLAVAGGTETRSKPVGTIFMAVVYKGQPHTMTKHFKGSPLDIKKKACEALYEMIIGIVGK